MDEGGYRTDVHDEVASKVDRHQARRDVLTVVQGFCGRCLLCYLLCCSIIGLQRA